MTDNSPSINSNPCSSCRAMGNRGQCPGHASGSGGSGERSNGSSKSNENQNNSHSSITYSNAPHNLINDELKINDLLENELLENRTVNYQAGMLTIESNRLLGNFIFRINPKANQYESNACHEFFKLIQHQFNQFKRELNENRISSTNFSSTLKEGQLTIRIPNPKYFDEFVKLLVQTNLLPLPNETQSLTSESASHSSPNPFGNISKGPRPKGWKEETD